LDRSAFLARPASIDLDVEGKAQEGPHENDAGKDQKALDRRLDCHRVDDVCGNQDLQAEQD